MLTQMSSTELYLPTTVSRGTLQAACDPRNVKAAGGLTSRGDYARRPLGSHVGGRFHIRDVTLVLDGRMPEAGRHEEASAKIGEPSGAGGGAGSSRCRGGIAAVTARRANASGVAPGERGGPFAMHFFAGVVAPAWQCQHHRWDAIPRTARREREPAKSGFAKRAERHECCPTG